MKKILLLTLSLITSLTLAGQYPATGNKMRLGFQTTGDGLVYRGTVSDTSTLDPSSINNAWMLLDTTNGAVFIYRSKAWRSITMPYDSVTFNINNGDASLRELKYSDERGQLQYGGQDSIQIPLLPGIWYVRNDTSITIPKGTVVRASGTLGASGRIKVKHMIANGSMPARYILGITMHDIAVGADGYIMFDGKIRNINTNGYSDADVLFADPQNPGRLRVKEPTGDSLKLPIVFVVHAANNGTIAVRITTGSYLHESHDVDTTGRVDGSVLRYDGTARYWKASTSRGILAADTASMLTNYINVVDTSSMLSPYLKKADTTSLSNRINLKLNISDTSSMLTNYINVVDTSSMLLPYLRKSQMRGTATYIPKYATDSTLTNSVIRESNSKIGIGTSASSFYTINVANSDTGPGTAGGMYIGLTSAKTIDNKGIVVDVSGSANNYTGIESNTTGGVLSNIALKAAANGFGGGTNAIGGQFSATNATNNYAVEISSGTATDSLSYAIYSSSAAKTYLNGRLGLGLTNPQRTLQVKGTVRVDTLTRDVPTRILGADADGDLAQITLGTGLSLSSGTLSSTSTIDTTSLSNRINLKLNISDTTSMLSTYLKKQDTVSLSNRINLKLNISDTTSMLSTYLKKQDTLSLSNRINLKLNISDTSVFARDWQITGTANYIPEFTGTNSIGNSIIYENSGKIGINTLTADSTLTVNGGGRFTNLVTAGGFRVTSSTSPVNGIFLPSSNRVGISTNNTEKVRIDSTGNVGIGTTSPTAYRLHVTQATNVGLYLNASGSGTLAPPTTYAPGTGGLLFAYASQAGDNFRRFLDIVSDGSGGSAGSVIRFFTGNTATAERMRITQDGDVGIGTTTAGSKLTVVGTASLGSGAVNSTGSGYQTSVTSSTVKATTATNTLLTLLSNDALASNPLGMFFDLQTHATAGSRYGSIQVGEYGTGNYRYLVLNSAGGETLVGGTTDNGVYNLQCNGTGVWGAGAYQNGSDIRLKENVEEIDSALHVVMNLRPVTYNYIESFSKDQTTQPGFIAQDLQVALEGKNYANGIVIQGSEYLSVAYQNLIPLLTKAIQEQQSQIQTLRQEIEILKSQINK